MRKKERFKEKKKNKERQRKKIVLRETEILTKKDKQIHTDGQQELEEVNKHGVREKGIERKER